MTNYVLTAKAEADLRDIIRYTRNEWSDTQVQRYISKLEVCIIGLAAGLHVFKNMDTIFPTLRMVKFEHHYIFFLLRKVEPILIVAILHERMDLMTRLAERLNE